MAPDRVKLPPLSVSEPKLPDITPEYEVLPFVTVNVLPARVTPPAPDKVTIEAPVVTPLMLNVPAFATSLDAAIEPEPDSAKVAPLLIVVVPV